MNPVVGIILTSVVCAIGGQITFKAAMNRMGFVGRDGITGNWRAALLPLAAGLGLYAMSMVTWLFALSKVELSFAFPFVSLSYIGIIVMARVALGERLTLPRIVGGGLILSGVLLVTLTA